MPSWISKPGSLTTEEMNNNANIVIATLRQKGYDDNTIAGILGNMQNESSVNPGRYETGGSGYGLVQWTPQSVLINHANTLGLSPYTDGSVQLEVLDAEIKGQSGVNEWYSTQAFINNYKSSGASNDMVGITGQDFIKNTMRWNPSKLATLFMVCYERPSTNPNVNHANRRRNDAQVWISYMGGITEYTPRLSKSGMLGAKYWYSNTNPFYPSGYGLPNCTCYAWGRFWEISDVVPHLPTGNGGEWWDSVSGYDKGSEPALGSVLCLYQPGGAGHVAIVEEIHDDYIVTSNSGYSRNPGGYNDPLYFWTEKNYKSDNYVPSWATGYSFQGFIYNPEVPIIPPVVRKKQSKMPFILYLKKYI